MSLSSNFENERNDRLEATIFYLLFVCILETSYNRVILSSQACGASLSTFHVVSQLRTGVQDFSRMMAGPAESKDGRLVRPGFSVTFALRDRLFNFCFT